METGRFLQRDPVWDAANWGGQYTFGGNGPVSLSDAMGLTCDKPWYEDTYDFLIGDDLKTIQQGYQTSYYAAIDEDYVDAFLYGAGATAMVVDKPSDLFVLKGAGKAALVKGGKALVSLAVESGAKETVQAGAKAAAKSVGSAATSAGEALTGLVKGNKHAKEAVGGASGKSTDDLLAENDRLLRETGSHPDDPWNKAEVDAQFPTAKGPVRWVKENAHMSDRARAYDAGAAGSRPGQAPALDWVDDVGKKRTTKFDGVDQAGTMIDRKLNVFGTKKAKTQIDRQASALRQNNREARWELPTQQRAKAAQRAIDRKGHSDRIKVKVVPEGS